MRHRRIARQCRPPRALERRRVDDADVVPAPSCKRCKDTGARECRDCGGRGSLPPGGYHSKNVVDAKTALGSRWTAIASLKDRMEWSAGWKQREDLDWIGDFDQPGGAVAQEGAARVVPSVEGSEQCRATPSVNSASWGLKSNAR